MTIRIDGEIEIDNLRHYPVETVEKLRATLAAGADAHPDPRRRFFYDIHNCSQVFFIHISPISGKVMLLASWTKPKSLETVQEKVCST